MGAEQVAIAVVALVLGAAVGSFLNVVIHRLPAGESVVAPRSRCPSCRRAIAWYDNLPVVSWLVLRGRCRACRAPISARYPIVEALTALVAVALALRHGPTLAFLGSFYFACALLALTYIDLDHQILPDRITLPGIVVGLALAALAPGSERWVALQSSLVGVAAGGGILWLVAWSYHALTGREGMGGGDVKLLAMIGAFLGWKGVLLTLLLASLLGSAIGVAIMIRQRADAKLAIPFGPFLALGALVTLFWGDRIVAWYIDSLGLAQY